VRPPPEQGCSAIGKRIFSKICATGLGRRGLLEIDDPVATAGMLRGMMMEPQRATMLRQRKPPSSKEITARAKVCARLFLQGCMSDAARRPGK